MDLIQLLSDKPILFEPQRLRALAERCRAFTPERQAALASRRYTWQLTAGVGIINVLGPIGNDWWTLYLGGTSPDEISEALRQARDEDQCKTILMIFDSPGGTTDLLEETADLIRAVNQVKPVVGSVRPFCASAAYWLASQCGELVITPSGQAGSIGCYLLHVEASRLNERLGVTPTYIFSDVSPYKTEGNPYEVLSPDALDYYQKDVDRIGAQFVDYVARGRRVTPSQVRAKFGGGRMLDAQAARRAGLVDRIETLELTVARVAARRSGTAMSAAERDAINIIAALSD